MFLSEDAALKIQWVVSHSAGDVPSLVPRITLRDGTVQPYCPCQYFCLTQSLDFQSSFQRNFSTHSEADVMMLPLVFLLI